MTYDAAGERTDQTDTAGSTTLGTLTYAYDADGHTDAILAADQYEQAANLAPWVLAYQRNLCVLEYAAGEYRRAANDCMWGRDTFRKDPTISRIYAKLNSMKNIF
ncbi:MAG: hypothetical protein ACYDDO_08655 [Acidiferrobacterales bacterium]